MAVVFQSQIDVVTAMRLRACEDQLVKSRVVADLGTFTVSSARGHNAVHTCCLQTIYTSASKFHASLHKKPYTTVGRRAKPCDLNCVFNMERLAIAQCPLLYLQASFPMASLGSSSHVPK